MKYIKNRYLAEAFASWYKGRMKHYFYRLFVVLLFFFQLLVAGGVGQFFSNSAWAEESLPKNSSVTILTEHADVTLFLASYPQGKEALLGLSFELEDGWKIYGQEPSDVGFPPEIDHSSSSNLSALNWRWPITTRQVDSLGAAGELVSHVYQDQVTFPLSALPKDPSEPMALDLQLRFAICKEICIAEDVSFVFSAPVGFYDADALQRREESFRNNGWFNGMDVTASTLLLMALLAFFGGVILNVMPCVLPVLSLKLLSVVKHSGQSHRHIAMSFLAISAGILASFWLLGAIVIGLKSIGMEVGWGFQFQDTGFLVVMILILALFACSLFGWWELRLPSSITTRLAAVGSHDSWAGNMLLGGFATLLATPCTAPMIGTALGFAFASGPLGIGLVFTMMALGMSLPYLLFALFPSWTSKLPKPGPWMGAVRSVMGVLLLITALWLLKVMASHAGWDAVLMLAGAICAIVMGSYYYYHRRMNVRFKVAVVVMLVALASVGMFFSGSKGSSSSDRDAGWEAFAPEKIPGYVIEGKLVLVDVTADWCLTCKINKLLVLNGMTQELASDGVVLMQGDWTAPNLAIVSYLASHQRSGIPFNIVHGPGAPEGIILPELLTESSVREALQSAR